MRILRFFLHMFFLIFQIANAETKVTVFPHIAVEKSNLNLFSTPLAYYQGKVYTVNIEPVVSGVNNGLNLRTIVRKAVVSENGDWKWISKTIDNETIEDKYHTQASIGVDKQGYLHIAYGMHNMPWQYVVSRFPGDISAFSFYGDTVSYLEKVAVKHLNKTPFPSIGTAAIAGNQITYPAFFFDRQNNLYITYRFAVKPKRQFKDRGFSGAIAYYDIATKKWISLGGNILISRQDAEWHGNVETTEIKAFAFEDQWAVYLPRLAFDKENGMHVSWMWRQGGAGRDASHPSYAYSSNNGKSFYTNNQRNYSLPISIGQAEKIGISGVEKFDAISEIAVDDHYVYVVLHRMGKTRELNKLNRHTREWSKNEKMPYSASIFKIDANGGQWAFATGLTALYRPNEHEKWKVVYKEENQIKYGYPKVLQISEKNEFYIHTQSLNLEKVKIYKLEY